jgi:hypothetical protein
MTTAVNGWRSLALVACGLALVSAFIGKASVNLSARTPQGPASSVEARPPALCGGATLGFQGLSRTPRSERPDL